MPIWSAIQLISKLITVFKVLKFLAISIKDVIELVVSIQQLIRRLHEKHEISKKSDQSNQKSFSKTSSSGSKESNEESSKQERLQVIKTQIEASVEQAVLTKDTSEIEASISEIRR